MTPHTPGSSHHGHQRLCPHCRGAGEGRGGGRGGEGGGEGRGKEEIKISVNTSDYCSTEYKKHRTTSTIASSL